RWLQCSKLKPIETAPRLTNHSNRAVGPFLVFNPRDYFQCIILLLFWIFILDWPVRISCTSDLYTERSVTHASKIFVTDFITKGSEFIFPVWKIFKYSAFCLFRCFRLP